MYIDTSVAVKLYTPEPDSEACEAVVGEASLVSSELLHCELRSALWGKLRMEMLSEESLGLAWARFEQHLNEGRMHLVPLDRAIVRDASEMIMSVHPDVPLRTLDALHLATFCRVRAGPLFTKDKRMGIAARRLHLPLAG